MKASTMLAVGVGLAASGIGCPPACAAVRPSVRTAEPGLIGTWRLVRFENRAKDGSIAKPYGEHPRGYFVYDPTGHLSINIMRNPPLPPFASHGEEQATDAEKVKAYEAYVGYFGTYHVDRVHHVLHHLVQGALNPIYTDTDQLRPYKLKRDVLLIEVDDPKDGTHYYRELHRVR
jgi:hypothetical protein